MVSKLVKVTTGNETVETEVTRTAEVMVWPGCDTVTTSVVVASSLAVIVEVAAFRVVTLPMDVVLVMVA